jgi:hypothetical protein
MPVFNLASGLVELVRRIKEKKERKFRKTRESTGIDIKANVSESLLTAERVQAFWVPMQWKRRLLGPFGSC